MRHSRSRWRWCGFALALWQAAAVQAQSPSSASDAEESAIPDTSRAADPPSADSDEDEDASERDVPRGESAKERGEGDATAEGQKRVYRTAADIPYIPPERDGGITWDAALLAGGGLSFDDAIGGREHFLLRGRAGVLFPRDPNTFALGLTGSLGGLADLGIGLEAEFISLPIGVAFYGGVDYTLDVDEWATHLGIGYTLVTVEWQHRFDGSNALFFNVRVPFGTIALLL